MAVEIRRSNWSRFCRKFSASNQYRSATLTVKRPDDNEAEISQGFPFMGVFVTKKGRLIDGIALFSGQNNPGRMTEPALSVSQPVRLTLVKDDGGMDNGLSVECKDGTVANIVLSGERDPRSYRSYVEQVAYSIAERRGFAPGNDVDDWLEAERKITEVGLQFTR